MMSRMGVVQGRWSSSAIVAVASSAVILSACSSKKEEGESALAAIASGSMAVRAPAPSVAAPAEPEKPVVKRPKDAADILLSSERRAKVEAFAPQAKGFLTSAELEEKLYAMNLKRGVDADALRELDRLAAGKWVLFTGNIGNPTPDGFELPIRYTPKDPNDSMGLTSVWLAVKFTKIEGYSSAEYRPGELAVVLAKYQGKKIAGGPGSGPGAGPGNGPFGYDLVLSRHWFD